MSEQDPERPNEPENDGGPPASHDNNESAENAPSDGMSDDAPNPDATPSDANKHNERDVSGQDGANSAEAELKRWDEQAHPEPEYANPEDFGLTRDGEADRNPIDKNVPGVGMCNFTPLNYGDVQNYFGDAGAAAEADPDTLAKVIHFHLNEPDLSELSDRGRVTGTLIKNMRPMYPRNVVLALFDASGIEADLQMDNEGNAEIEFEEPGN
jgi:hypothetical protein